MPYNTPEKRKAYRAANRDCRTAQKRAWLDRMPAEYQLWEGMKRRCYSPNDPAYPRYGKRGVKVCSQWRESFAAFLADMGSRPTAKHTLDRKSTRLNSSHSG